MRHTTPHLQLRMLVSLAILGLLASVLLGRLGQLQLTDHEAASGANSPVTAVVPVPALRGRILDRRGQPIVDNSVRTDVTIDRATLADSEDGGRTTVRAVAEALELPFDRVWARTTLCGAPGAADPPLCWSGSAFVPVPLAVDVDPARAVALTERPERYPGVQVTSQPVRSYGGTGSGGAVQTVGYLTRPTAQAVEESGGRITDAGLVGAAGLELQYDDLLRGRPGRRTVRVDARGVAVAEVERTKPVPGSDLVTTLDLEVQRATEEALVAGVRSARARGYAADSAAAVVLDLRDGGVLASASLPTYDPAVWSQGVTQAQYDRLTKGENSPLVDRVTAVAQPPASTFKVVSLPGAVASGVDLDEEVNCTSSHRVGDRTFNNYESRSYGWISWRRAIVVSCDTVFYQVAEDVWRAQGGLDAEDDGRDPLIRTARRFGLGSVTGIDLPAESPGRIPDREWKQQWWESTREESCRRAEEGYPDMEDRSEAGYLEALAEENCAGGYLFRPGDEANLSIGQGDVTATLLQMATVFGGIARQGRIPDPHLGLASVSADGTRTDLTRSGAGGDRIELPGASGKVLRAALEDVVSQSDGTAHAAFTGFPLGRWPVAGKTGTAEVYGEQDTAWFVSFAPADDPRYVVGVVVSQGGTGGATSAPIARQIHQALLAREAR